MASGQQRNMMATLLVILQKNTMNCTDSQYILYTMLWFHAVTPTQFSTKMLTAVIILHNAVHSSFK
jgi:hypothetical protein